ncbi:EAL and HDOD domain-containing protein [Noviherbaspirillum aerium]|uniref:EAL and HDOD domain-containing protein n=1 Tax=Noviherbaspirillum aerium TaxID=2588497 RepID=UPI00124EE797|nr:HDOD domain-containing protein [Noviherbaspirillum aerium]
MHAEKFIVREPLVNSQERVLGYEITWHGTAASDPLRPDADILLLASFVAEQLNDTDSGALLGDQVIFIEARPMLLEHEEFGRLPPNGTILVLRGDDLSAEGVPEAIKSARAKGYGISLRDVDIASLDRAVLEQVTHIETNINSAGFPAQVQQFRALNLLTIRLVARCVDSWQAFELCKKLGIQAFVGNLHLTLRPGQHARELNPAQSLILQLMDMVRQNADVKQLEGVLKRDAALSYKLLRYINSAGFGLGCEIQSLKHAVTMLGYSPLYRWLALLLATATTTGYSPVLMHAAIVRGRFAELLGSTFLPRHEAENLFVAGMFSLLDKLLGVPMDDVLEKIQLSEPVTQALLTREGIYGPFLALAEACELHSKDVNEMAGSLCIDARQVNQAQLSALAWAQRIAI